MVIKVDSLRRYACLTASGTPTLAGWHGATPGAVVGAGPRGRVVSSDHDVARLTQEGHVLAHGDIVPETETVGGDARVAAGDHWSNTRTSHQISSWIMLNCAQNTRYGFKMKQCFHFLHSQTGVDVSTYPFRNTSEVFEF